MTADRRTPNPNGCRHCGADAREHLQRWTPLAGWHTFAEPTNEQRKDRMLARRDAALAAERRSR